MDQQTAQALGATLEAIENNQKLRLTSAAKRLIMLTIETIETDRPPYQLEPKLTPAQCQRLAVERLPSLISFASRKLQTKEIGLFQLLEAAPQLMSIYVAFKMPDP